MNGKIYVPTTGALYCVGTPGADSAAAELPELPQESPRSEDETPAQLQLVPVESLLRPGTRQPYDVRLYNSRGQYLRNASPDEVQFSIEGPGTIDEFGRYTILNDQEEHAPVSVTAKMGQLEGQARIRVIPDLDWSFDFDNGEVPITFIGARYRHIVLDWDLLSKLRDEDALAGNLYIYLMTEFTNFAPKRDFDDSTPQQRWTALLRFLGLDEGESKPKTLEQAQATFGPALDRLKEENVVSSIEWSTWPRPTGNEDETVPEPKLSVVKGTRKVDGNGVMCKIKTIPKGARSQGWMGLPDLHDYTIQADVLGFARDGKLPDIGLVAQRYTIDLMGAAQQLQFRTWTPQLNRFSAVAPVEWSAETWYTLKFRASVVDGQAVLRGKVWKRDEDEPNDWQLVATDEIPNEVGSPGLFGNAKDSEIFYDNLTVTRNVD